MLEIRLESIKDASTREALDNVVAEFRDQAMLNFLWKPFSASFTAGGTYDYVHGLGYRPKDYLITGILASSGESAYIDLDDTDNTTVSITVSGACTVRFLLGNLDTNSQV